MRATSAPIALAAFALLASPLAAAAEDAYFVQSIGSLTITEGELPTDPESRARDAWRRYSQFNRALRPLALIDDGGEAYVTRWRPGWSNLPTVLRDTTLAVRATKGKAVTGRLFVPSADWTRLVAVRFKIDPAQANADQRKAFMQAKRDHYQQLLNRDIPGAAWFRHQVRLAKDQLDERPESGATRQSRRVWGRQFGSDLQDTFALLTGGRALSENLQLDRELPSTDNAEGKVPLDSIQGITVREFDWKPLVQDLGPELDPLAKLVPHDQHAVFFPSFAAMVDVVDHATTQGTPVLRMAEPRSEDARTRQRYEKQLGLPMSSLARLIGPHLVNGVALTGADPYLRTGTDVALLFDAKNVGALQTLITAQVMLNSKGHPGAEQLRGETAGVPYVAVRSPNRAVSSYVAAIDNTVIVTNSPVQLAHLVDVAQGRRQPLSVLDEYWYFRDRYQRGAKDESALIMISDATIRRWCGPRWRIGTSRRTRAAAVMAELQAKRLDDLAAGAKSGEQLSYNPKWADAGTLTIGPAGVQSSRYGTLEFHTPIVELEMDQVTQQERDLYKRWRDGYQRNWSNFFDPIAVRLTARADKLAADVTVMPLIDGSAYNQFADVARGSAIKPDASDPHEGTLLHYAMAINRKSPTIQQLNMMAVGMAPQLRVDPLSWLGETISFYADDDPFWAEMAKAKDPRDFMERNFHRMPAAMHVEVSNGFKLTAFLAGLRGFIEQAAPGMTVWTTKEHNEQPYVRISPSTRAVGGNDEEAFKKLAVYYVATGDAFVLTLNEDLLKRSMDRMQARREAGSGDKPEDKPQLKQGPRWLGKSVGVQANRHVLQLMQVMFGENYQRVMQLAAWGNIPILNEWRRRYPQQDPVALHERLWQRRLVCPGGGDYRWNEAWQTMESTVYGHPGEPKAGPGLPVALQRVSFANFGLTFEEHGLRTNVELTMKPAE